MHLSFTLVHNKMNAGWASGNMAAIGMMYFIVSLFIFSGGAHSDFWQLAIPEIQWEILAIVVYFSGISFINLTHCPFWFSRSEYNQCLYHFFINFCQGSALDCAECFIKRIESFLKWLWSGSKLPCHLLLCSFLPPFFFMWPPWNTSCALRIFSCLNWRFNLLLCLVVFCCLQLLRIVVFRFLLCKWK